MIAGAAGGMDWLESACFEADVDTIHYLRAQYLDKSMVIQADDYLQITAKLNTTTAKGKRKRLSVADDFIEVMDAHPTIQRSVKGYIHRDTGAYLETLPDAVDIRFYRKVEVRTIQPDKYTVLIYNGRNHFQIKIHKLAHFAGCRYRTLLNTLVDCNVFVHKARVSNPTRNHKRDSMRNILKRDFKMNMFEWGFTFNAEISAFVAPALRRSAVLTLDGMSYLYPPLFESGSGKNKVIQATAKIYNVSALQESRKDNPYEYIVGDIFKFEITYTPAFFQSKNHKYATIPAFKLQRDIFALLLKDNLGQFEKHVLNNLTKNEKTKLFIATGTPNLGEFMQKLSNAVSLQTNVDIDGRVILDRLAALENLSFERYAEFCAFRAETRDFMATQQSNVDMRKPRNNSPILIKKAKSPNTLF
jgi:hypothetical protein